MAQQCCEISNKLKQFIEDQKIFFVGTATLAAIQTISECVAKFMR